MSEAKTNVASWAHRVARSEPARKGFAGAVAGFLIAAVSETLWPTKS
jgi:hypothetical protein